MSNPTRFKNGVNNSQPGYNLANLPHTTTLQAFQHFDDFVQYVAADWTVTTGANAGTTALTAGQGGRIILTTAAVSTADYEAIQKTPATFNFSSTQQVWFEVKMQASVVAASILLAGITAGSLGATLAPTDGIYFKKNAAAATVDLVLTKASTSTTLASVATLVAATDVRLGFYYNGKDAVEVYVNDSLVARQSTLTNLPTATALSASLGVVNGAAVATTLTSDFVLAAQDRTNP